ncbi:MAG TPA: WhiB family transcriptional regulator [Acidimicrobiales bacterium]|nr:WhiB family transcriptional regulator [Acidimicrobiales bacterium]
MTLTSLEWSSGAACRGSEGSLFYSADTAERKEDRLEREQMAKRICSGCSVRDECLHSALDRHESYGIWGGLNEFERRSLTRS